ncbi:glycosyltransferase family 4 protein [Microbacterium abyssi]|uniref:glycosyltransferase family 4 protein n=1 Tax=Microbacterium abyssi TaxID=2782166 RepID=UPI0018894341|nr:glycosyltransferase family 4 protein [Microbacterium sp. A18JL241]
MASRRPASRSGVRTVIASRIFAPEPSAASLRLSALAAELDERGVDVRVLTTRPPRGTATGPDLGLDVRRWPVLRDRSGYVRGYLPYLSFDAPLFVRVLFGARGDVYVCEPPPTTGFFLRLACAIARRPYVYYAADIWSDAAQATGAPDLVIRTLRSLESFAIRGAQGVIVVTDGVASRVAALAPGANAHVVGHGVDLNRFSPDGGEIANRADIVYVGSASEWHGAEIAVRAVIDVLRSEPKTTAAFVGQGSSWPALRAAVYEAGLSERIRFVATVPPEQAAAWLRGARVSLATLVPGQGYDFAVPTKLYASVAVGTPVAYAGPDPVRGVVNQNELGRGVEYDEQALADAIRELLVTDRPEARKRLTSWAHANVSARAVARRSADAILAVAGTVTAGSGRRR